MNREKGQFIGNLINAEIIKFGKFRLKSGLEANIYFDLRAIVRYPLVLKELVYLIQKWILPGFIGKYDVLCGVPMGAIGITSALGYSANEPVVLLRDKVKEYGLQKRVEGKRPEDNRCILIEDVTTTGGSIAEAIRLLRSDGLETIVVFVVVDRRQVPGEPIENVPVIPILTQKEIEDYFVRELTAGPSDLKKVKI